MKAMLLAAGLGERLRPLTLSEPKPSLPVLGRPLAVQLLQWMGRHGVSEATLNLHHLPERVRRTVGAGSAPGLPRVHYTDEPKILGTAGGLRNASQQLIGDGPIVVCNADFLSDIDLAAVVERHAASGHLATLVLVPVQPGYSVVETDSAGRVVALAGTPEVDPAEVAGRWTFSGCHVIEEQVLELIPEGRPSDIVRDVYRTLAAQRKLGSFQHEGFWWEFGDPQLYLDGSMRLLDATVEQRRRITDELDPVREVGGGIVAVGPGSQLHPEARVVGRAALGYASHVGEGTVLEDTVVMPEAWVGPGCRLRRSVVGLGTELPAGFTADGIVVCNRPDSLPPAVDPVEAASGLMVRPLRADDR